MRMVEKVAQAMNEYAGNQFSDELALDLACIALQTARNADEAMLGAGARVHDHWAGERTVGGLNAERNAREVFRAMIDKAQEDGE